MPRLSEIEAVKGDQVLLKREFMDEGDENLIFIAVDDMEKGRVSIMPINTGLSFPPVQTINRYMISQCMKRITLQTIRDNYGVTLDVVETGGNCTANHHELNTNQDYFFIADNHNALNDDFKQDISIVIFNSAGDELASRDLSSLFDLNEYLAHVFAIWGY